MTIEFPDVSEYTPNVDVTPYPVVLARATLSDRVADNTYTAYRQKSAGKVFVAYHWLNHGNVAAQAAWCFQHVGPGTPVMIDAEDVSGNTGYAGPLTVTDLTGFAAEYRALGGTVSLVYLPEWYWRSQMGAPDLRPVAAAGLSLVSSYYTTYSDNGPGWGSYGGVTPVQWQYTSTPVDMNAYRGTVAEYAQMVGGTMTNPLTPVEGRQLANADQWQYDIITEQDPVTQIYAAPDGTNLPLPNLPLQRAKRIEQKIDDLAAAVKALAAPAPVDTHAVATDVVTQLQGAGFLTADVEHTLVHAEVKSVLDTAFGAAAAA